MMLQKKDIGRGIGAKLIPYAALFVAWQGVATMGIVNTTLLPAPTEIAATAWDLVMRDSILLRHIYASLTRLIIGLGMGIVIGMAVGILIGSSKVARQMFSPLISILITIPTIALVPALLITVGIGSTTVIIAIFLACFFPVTYGTVNGIQGISQRYLQAAAISGARRWFIFRNILLPGSLRSILPGLRLAIGYSWGALVGAEMLASGTWGIGHMIYAARTFYAVDVMFVGLVVIALGGFIMDKIIISYIERKTVVVWGMVSER
jgi:ABC-type nitrate/sulfonate/bicarbonate transport system permease component